MTDAGWYFQRPFVSHRFSGEGAQIRLGVHLTLLRTDDFTGGPTDEARRVDSFPLQPATKDVHTALLPVEPENDIVDRLQQLAKPLFAREQRVNPSAGL